MTTHNLINIPKLPLEDWVSGFVSWLTTNLSGFFNAIQQGGQAIMDTITSALMAVPMPLMIIGITALAFAMTTKNMVFPFLLLWV